MLTSQLYYIASKYTKKNEGFLYTPQMGHLDLFYYEQKIKIDLIVGNCYFGGC